MAAGDFRPSKRGWLAVKEEVTYGVDPVIDPVTDTLYAEEPEANQETEALERTGEAPRRPGWGSVDGAETNTLNFTTEIRGLQVVDAASRPHEHTAWRIVGASDPSFVTTGTVNTLRYTILDANFGSVTAHKYEEIQDPGNGTYQQLLGVRGTGTFPKEHNQRVMLQVEAMGKEWSTVDYSGIATDDLDWDDTNDECRNPFVFRDVTAILSTLDGLTVYQGGLLTAEAPLEMNPEIHRVANSSGGIVRIYQRPEAGMQHTIQVEAVPKADFDPYALRQARTVLKYVERIYATDGPAGRDWIDFVSYLKIATVTKDANVDGRRAWTLGVELVWPETTPGNANDPTVITGGSDDAGCSPKSMYEVWYTTDTAIT